MIREAAEHLDDDRAMRVLSDALMEHDDPRGLLITLMLEEERQSEPTRKARVDALITDFAPKWAPPGARITGFRRGLPVTFEWNGPTDPQHVAWCSARSIHATLTEVPSASVFDVMRPQLTTITGLQRRLFEHVLGAAPPNLEVIDGEVPTEALLNGLAASFERLTKLEFATARSTHLLVDPGLGEPHLRGALQAAARLKRIRLSLPNLRLDAIDTILASAPQLDVQFIAPWLDFRDEPITVNVDLRRRTLSMPGGPFGTRGVAEQLNVVLGARLTVL